MDLLTKSLMFEKRRNKSRNKQISITPGEGFAVIFNKKKISGNYINTIHDIVQGCKTLLYWKNRGDSQWDKMLMLTGT